jgi:hypothetical protein
MGIYRGKHKDSPWPWRDRKGDSGVYLICCEAMNDPMGIRNG